MGGFAVGNKMHISMLPFILEKTNGDMTDGTTCATVHMAQCLDDATHANHFCDC
jgi:hypothetical protein